MSQRAAGFLLGVAAALGAVIVCVPASSQTDARTFRAPRVGVVDISRIFDAYEKKKDREEQFKSQVKDAEDKLKDFEKRYKELLAEIPNIEAGEKRSEMELEKFKLEQEIKNAKQKEMERLKDTQMKYLQEIRDEISEEIQSLAKALDLDMIFEKTVVAELGPQAAFRWPIVHFSKSEFEVTADIATRLNNRYRASHDPARNPVEPGRSSNDRTKGGSTEVLPSGPPLPAELRQPSSKK